MDKNRKIKVIHNETVNFYHPAIVRMLLKERVAIIDSVRIISKKVPKWFKKIQNEETYGNNKSSKDASCPGKTE